MYLGSHMFTACHFGPKISEGTCEILKQGLTNPKYNTTINTPFSMPSKTIDMTIRKRGNRGNSNSVYVLSFIISVDLLCLKLTSHLKNRYLQMRMHIRATMIIYFIHKNYLTVLKYSEYFIYLKQMYWRWASAMTISGYAQSLS